MISRWRQIRRSLINSKSTRRYLLYALGEILLVVLGILIALQINNWNENRKNDIAAKKYLHRILADLQDDLNESEEIYSSHLTRVKMILEALRDFEAKSYYEFVRQEKAFLESIFEDPVTFSSSRLIPVDYDSFGYKLSRIHRLRQFEVADATFRELIASGHFDFIRSDDLKNSIRNYYQTVSEQTAFEPRILIVREDYRQVLLDNNISNLSMATFDEIQDQLKDKDRMITVLENFLNLSQRTLNILYLREDSMRPLSVQLIADIKVYLNSY